jgi:hypothetical protein
MLHLLYTYQINILMAAQVILHQDLARLQANFYACLVASHHICRSGRTIEIDHLRVAFTRDTARGVYGLKKIPESTYFNTILQSEAGAKLRLVETIYLCRRALVGDVPERLWRYGFSHNETKPP